MSASSVVALVGEATGSQPVLLVACVLSGASGALGGGMWVSAYVRLDARRAALYAFLSLALGAVGGYVLGFFPKTTAHIATTLLPAVALLCYQRAIRVDIGQHAAAQPAPRYDSEPKSTMLFIFGGVAVFGLALGLSRGLPDVKPVQMDMAMRTVYQSGVVLLSLFVVWWTNVRGKNLSFSLLWRIEILLVASGMLLISLFPNLSSGLVIAVINIADAFMLGVMWITLQDIARHSSVSPCAIFGSVWATRVLSRDVGRVLIMALGAAGLSSYAVTAVIGIVVFALAASMALLLSDGILRSRPLFAEDVARPNRKKAEPVARIAHRETAPQADAMEWLRVTFDLSDREAEIAALIAQGRSKTYIAEQLFLSENTVRTHAKNAYAKAGVHSKQELMDLLQKCDEG